LVVIRVPALVVASVEEEIANMPYEKELSTEERASVKKDVLRRLYHHKHKPDPADLEYQTFAGLARRAVGVGIGPTVADSGRHVDHVYVDRLERVVQAGDPVRIGTLGENEIHAVEAGRFFSFQPEPPKAAPGSTVGLEFKDPDKRPNINPALAGTLGAFVKIKVNGDDKYYMLGSNHVMAVNGRVPTGTALVFRPPTEFIANDPSKYIFAKTAVHVPLRLVHPDPGEWETSDKPNNVDCALAEVDEEQYRRRVDAGFPDVEIDPGAPLDPKRGMEVRRVDDGGLSMMGKIVDIDAGVRLDYSFGTYYFDHQIIIEAVPKDPSDPEDPAKKPFAFARPGDSGALIVDEKTKKAVALVVGGSERYTVACWLSTVFEELKAPLQDFLAKQEAKKVQARLMGTQEASMRETPIPDFEIVQNIPLTAQAASK
jgi:hypothetical protein